MVDDRNLRREVADELGRTIFKIDATIGLLYGGKVIPAHEKLHGIKSLLLNLHGKGSAGIVEGEIASNK
jgi:hypothetical protein